MGMPGHRRRFAARPPLLGDGALIFPMERALVRRNAEIAIVVAFIARRRLFGDVYSQLLPDYFWKMPRGSGVLIQPLTPTRNIAPKATRPGDIDLLIVPYEGDELVLDQTLAVEAKVLRASHARPGKSPNEFGFSQAGALLELGFPYVAVAHLIVSDTSPIESWREAQTYKVLDSFGNLGEPSTEKIDFLPLDLVDRAFGRLQRGCPDDRLGLAAAYVRNEDHVLAEQHSGTWNAECRPASLNPNFQTDLLDAISAYLQARPNWWFDTPRFDPEGEVS